MPLNCGAGEKSPLDCKEIKPVNPKGNQPWIIIGGTDTKAEASIFWPPDAKSQLIRKGPDVGKDWRQEKGMTEDEMVGWHHLFNGHEYEQTLGDGEGQGGLECCSPWGRQELDMTEWLNNNDKCLWKSLSRVQLFATPWPGACQAPLSMDFSRPEYWSG